jgi:hypothetical protein
LARDGSKSDLEVRVDETAPETLSHRRGASRRPQTVLGCLFSWSLQRAPALRCSRRRRSDAASRGLECVGALARGERSRQVQVLRRAANPAMRPRPYSKRGGGFYGRRGAGPTRSEPPFGSQIHGLPVPSRVTHEAPCAVRISRSIRICPSLSTMRAAIRPAAALGA